MSSFSGQGARTAAANGEQAEQRTRLTTRRPMTPQIRPGSSWVSCPRQAASLAHAAPPFEQWRTARRRTRRRRSARRIRSRARSATAAAASDGSAMQRARSHRRPAAGSLAAPAGRCTPCTSSSGMPETRSRHDRHAARHRLGHDVREYRRDRRSPAPGTAGRRRRRACTPRKSVRCGSSTPVNVTASPSRRGGDRARAASLPDRWLADDRRSSI